MSSCRDTKKCRFCRKSLCWLLLNSSFHSRVKTFLNSFWFCSEKPSKAHKHTIFFRRVSNVNELELSTCWCALLDLDLLVVWGGLNLADIKRGSSSVQLNLQAACAAQPGSHTFPHPLSSTSITIAWKNCLVWNTDRFILSVKTVFQVFQGKCIFYRHWKINIKC